ncbi:MAG: cytochrome c [Rheinheimera sp.]|jgi:cytochrome c553|nr:cytochrome c [Rheinheimera sp.]
MNRFFLALGLLFTLNLAQAADIAAGKAKAAVCAACHGSNGISIIPDYPNLAGQKEKYLQSAIKAYRDGERKNAIMSPMATGLTDADVANLAAYFASLPAGG